MSKLAKKKTVSTATLAEIVEAQAEAERRRQWAKEKKDNERKCDLCKMPFHANRSWQVYCSDSCRVSAFQNKMANNETKLLGRLRDLEEENVALKAQIKELKCSLQSKT